MKPTILLIASLVLVACEPEQRSLVLKTTPLNGATSVSPSTQPRIEFTGAVSIQAQEANKDLNVSLFDITGGGKRRIGGFIEIEGSKLTFKPTDANQVEAPLQPNRQFSLEVLKRGVWGDNFDEVDASEWPDETVSWPFALRFRTKSCPRVRAAYHDKTNQRLVVGFSQKMEVLSTGLAIKLLDNKQSEVELDPPVWKDDQNVYISPRVDLSVEDIYTLKVANTAKAEDTTLLDGNDNGTPGETGDDFCVKFTGSQSTLLSRLAARNSGKCN
jgi:hypothetical protein